MARNENEQKPDNGGSLHRFGRQLRCHECKETFAPEPIDGRPPFAHENVKCPGCGWSTMEVFFIKVPTAEVSDGGTPFTPPPCSLPNYDETPNADK